MNPIKINYSAFLSLVCFCKNNYSINNYEIDSVKMCDGKYYICVTDAYGIYSLYQIYKAHPCSYDAYAILTIKTNDRIVLHFMDLCGPVIQDCIISNNAEISTVKAKKIIDKIYLSDCNVRVYTAHEINDLPNIKNIWYNDPYTSITFEDGSVVKAKAGQEDYSPEMGVYICLAKKYLDKIGIGSSRKHILDVVKSGVDLKAKKENLMKRKSERIKKARLEALMEANKATESEH